MGRGLSRFTEFGVKCDWGRINVRIWPRLNQAAACSSSPADCNKRLLLAHGYSDSVGCFSSVVDQLPSDWEIVGFDFPGHGDSDMPQAIYPPFDLGKALSLVKSSRLLFIFRITYNSFCGKRARMGRARFSSDRYKFT